MRPLRLRGEVGININGARGLDHDDNVEKEIKAIALKMSDL